MKRIDPLVVYSKGLKQISSLSSTERIVYLVMSIETDADIQSWDHFFMSKDGVFFDELKRMLIEVGDTGSAEVLSDFEAYLLSENVTVDPSSIATYVSNAGSEYCARCADWRAKFMAVAEERWNKIESYLRTVGYQLQR